MENEHMHVSLYAFQIAKSQKNAVLRNQRLHARMHTSRIPSIACPPTLQCPGSIPGSIHVLEIMCVCKHTHVWCAPIHTH